jgi:hypothetical protein
MNRKKLADGAIFSLFAIAYTLLMGCSYKDNHYTAEVRANKKAAALDALKGISERAKTTRDTAAAPIEETTEEEYRSVRIREDAEKGLLQMFFPRMPAAKVRQYLKKHGFAWEPGERCWQCERGETAGYHARKAVDRGGSDR